MSSSGGAASVIQVWISDEKKSRDSSLRKFTATCVTDLSALARLNHWLHTV